MGTATLMRTPENQKHLGMHFVTMQNNALKRNQSTPQWDHAEGIIYDPQLGMKATTQMFKSETNDDSTEGYHMTPHVTHPSSRFLLPSTGINSSDYPLPTATHQTRTQQQAAARLYRPFQHTSPPIVQNAIHPVAPNLTVTQYSDAAPRNAYHRPSAHILFSPQIPSLSTFNHIQHYHNGFSRVAKLHPPVAHHQSMITPPADVPAMRSEKQDNKRRRLLDALEEQAAAQKETSPFHRQPSPFHRQPSPFNRQPSPFNRQASPFLEQAQFQDSMVHPDDQLALDLQPQQEYASNRESKTHKRDVDIPINAEGKMVCTHQPQFKECATLTFERRCEWGKHMDKHERPYKCQEPGCEKLQGFTYSGGLLRHQREVHKAGGVREPLFCDFPGCKRSSGNGFTRKENLAEHKRRVHHRSSADSVLGPNDVPASVEETLQASIQGLHPIHSPTNGHDVDADAVASPETPTADHFIEPSLRSTSVKRKHTNIARDVDLELLLEENRRLREVIGEKDRRLEALEATNIERDRKQALMEQALKNAGLFDSSDRPLLQVAAEQYIANGSGT